MKHSILIALVCTGFACSKKDPVTPALPIGFDKPEVALHYNGSYQYSLTQGGAPLDAATFTWSTSDPYVGAISPAGLFTAKHIGQTTIKGLSSDKQTGVQSHVVVTPYSTAWIEPITTFGVNKASIKLSEKRTLQSETATGLFFYGETTQIRGVLYLFDADKLTSVGVFPQSTPAMVTEAATFLKERYDLIGSKNSVYYFTDNHSINVGITIDDQLGLTVLYLPYKTGGRLAAPNVATELAKPAALIDSTINPDALRTHLDAQLITKDGIHR